MATPPPPLSARTVPTTATRSPFGSGQTRRRAEETATISTRTPIPPQSQQGVRTMANDNLSNLPWEDPDYRAELDRSLMAYGAYLSRTELAAASTSRSLGEFDLPPDWYLLKDENNILDATGASGPFAGEFCIENHKK